MITGLPFVEAQLYWLGGSMIIAACALACLEMARGVTVDIARTWLRARFDALMAVPFSAIMLVAVRWTRDVADRALKPMIIEVDRSAAFSPLVLPVVGIFLPSASIVNALFGGSPALLLVYCGIVAGLFFLALSAESRSMSWVKGLVAWLCAVVGLVAAPFYAFWSLTSHILGSTFLHGAFAALFIAVICYAGAMGVWTLVRSGRDSETLGTAEKFLARLLFALPVCYLLYWLGLLAGFYAVAEPSPDRNWTGLLAVMGIGSLSFAVILATIDAGMRIAVRGRGLVLLVVCLMVGIAGMMAIAGLTGQLPRILNLAGSGSGAELSLDPAFWIAQVPVSFWVVILGSVVMLALGRLLVFVAPGGGAWILRHAFLAVAVWVSTGGLLAIGAGYALH